MRDEQEQVFDEEALAEAYNRALALEKAGEIDAAVAAYAEMLRIDPADHGGAAVRLASLGRGETPQKAPDAYVETLFGQQAGAFEHILVDQLGYDIPVKLCALLTERWPGPYRRMLDLGCGTGLAGEALRPLAAHITGIDLAEPMVEIAHEKNIGDRPVYDELYVGEAVDFLQNADVEPFDLITATDVLPYLGALEDFFQGLSDCTVPGALIGFSSETLPDDTFKGRDFMVGPHQRFAHTEGYLQKLLETHGFELVEMTLTTVRKERAKPVTGHLVVARKA